MFGFRLLMGRGCSIRTLRHRRIVLFILWCRGNACRIINLLESLCELYRIGLSVFTFNYHGYGRSQGSLLEEDFARGLNSTFQLRFLEAIRQLELRCRRLSDVIWTAPP
jgi:hypothetical protein